MTKPGIPSPAQVAELVRLRREAGNAKPTDGSDHSLDEHVETESEHKQKQA